MTLRPMRSAAKAEPAVGGRARVPRTLGERIKYWAEGAALNLWAILKEGWRDVRAADRYSKLKAGVVVAWLGLSMAGVTIACPEGFGNSLGAELIIAGDTDRPVYMIRNASKDVWEEVVVVVNGTYRLSIPRMEPRSDVTFLTRQLMGGNGKLAPDNLVVSEIEVRADEGKARLMHEGRLQ